MTIVCTTPQLGGTVVQVDYECLEGWVKEVVVEYEGRDWVCPVIHPRLAWKLADELIIPVA